KQQGQVASVAIIQPDKQARPEFEPSFSSVCGFANVDRSGLKPSKALRYSSHARAGYVATDRALWRHGRPGGKASAIVGRGKPCGLPKRCGERVRTAEA